MSETPAWVRAMRRGKKPAEKADPDARLTDRQHALKYALAPTPLPLILRAMLEEIRDEKMTDDEWIDWVDRVI